VNDTLGQTGEQEADVGRLGVMLADFPVTVPAVTFNQMCGSSQSHRDLESTYAGLP
jgi:acetyl-CoA acetyltransferase